jgi:nucleoside-diphosphate-sugar epimerase
VWHVARTCRKTGTRRDHETFLAEQKGMFDLLQTRARHCRFVYASSKIVYGLGGVSDDKDEVLPVEKVAEHFYDDRVGIHNCPEWQPTRNVDISRLDHQRTIYALTKLGNEQLVQKYCSNFKIIRIWDIV